MPHKAFTVWGFLSGIFSGLFCIIMVGWLKHRLLETWNAWVVQKLLQDLYTAINYARHSCLSASLKYFIHSKLISKHSWTPLSIMNHLWCTAKNHDSRANFQGLIKSCLLRAATWSIFTKIQAWVTFVQSIWLGKNVFGQNSSGAKMWLIFLYSPLPTLILYIHSASASNKAHGDCQIGCFTKNCLKKYVHTPTTPCRAYINHTQKIFFPRTSLKGPTT